VQVANLIQHDRVVDDARSVYLVELFDCVLFFQVEAENGVELLTVAPQASNQQNLGGGDLHRLETSDGLRDLKLHAEDFLLLNVEALN